MFGRAWKDPPAQFTRKQGWDKLHLHGFSLKGRTSSPFREPRESRYHFEQSFMFGKALTDWKLYYLKENFATREVKLTPEEVGEVRAIVKTVDVFKGDRYPAGMMAILFTDTLKL
jgi:hypothetical protein